jgi:hypothetical protein
MRYREFVSRKRNREQQVDEVLPAVAGIAARAAGGAVASTVGTQAKALFTPKDFQKQMGVGTQTKNIAGQKTPPVQIKPGVKILHPGIGPTKIKSIQGKDAVLDTEKELGQNIRVDQNELLAVLGQAQQEQK